jgi:3-oxoadipate enol-lactonase
MATASSHGITLYCEVSGSGPAIVFTHCFFFDGSFFKHQSSVLQRTHRIINIDMRGHGRSGPSDSPFTLYDLVDYVVAVLDAEAVTSAVWIGHSIGGFTVLRAALIRPERVRAMAILATDAGPESIREKVKYTFLKWV